MALVVGTDTYISIADASTYLTANYLSTDSKLIAWNALSDANKEVLLRKATRLLDQQPIVGYKVSTAQALAFPRMIWSDFAFDNWGDGRIYNGWYEQTSVPDDVKYAQCEIAVDNVNPNKRAELQRQGVKSFSLGSLSESYGSGTNNALPYTAREYLAPYIAGSVAIC